MFGVRSRKLKFGRIWKCRAISSVMMLDRGLHSFLLFSFLMNEAWGLSQSADEILSIFSPSGSTSLIPSKRRPSLLHLVIDRRAGIILMRENRGRSGWRHSSWQGMLISVLDTTFAMSFWNETTCIRVWAPLVIYKSFLSGPRYTSYKSFSLCLFWVWRWRVPRNHPLLRLSNYVIAP